VTVAHGYGAGAREVEVVTDTAVWYHTGRPPVPLRRVLIRDPQGTFAPQALRCTDQTATPARILGRFVQRWQLAVTLEEARRHRGIETQRQWSAAAIRRTTPALLGLSALVTLLAHERMPEPRCATRQAAWYHQERPTFGRRAGARPTRVLAAREFPDSHWWRCYYHNPARTARAPYRCPLLRGLNR